MNALHRLQKLAAFRVGDSLMSVASPQGRGVVGGALIGGGVGAVAGGEENRKKGIAAGMIAGGLGGGAIADVMANRVARGFKAGDKAHIRTATAENIDEYSDFARGHMSPDEITDNVNGAASLGIDLGIKNVEINDEHLAQLAQLGDHHRNRAIARGVGAAGMGALAATYRNQRGATQEKQASFMRGPSILAVNLEKRASAYGGAAAGGLLGAAYGHFGTKKEDRNWKRTLGHAGIGALAGGSMGLARKRGLELDEIEEKRINPLQEKLREATQRGNDLESKYKISEAEKAGLKTRMEHAEEMLKLEQRRRSID